MATSGRIDLETPPLILLPLLDSPRVFPDSCRVLEQWFTCTLQIRHSPQLSQQYPKTKGPIGECVAVLVIVLRCMCGVSKTKNRVVRTDLVQKCRNLTGKKAWRQRDLNPRPFASIRNNAKRT